ncbi:FAD-dependent oxidoreductase [Shinella sp. BYT-45]|uniref:FAD-dependent oxidoreductase n=1 Tax=Shinella sp. BYT-45 TaxID=3377377 RepID=UPI0039805B37
MAEIKLGKVEALWRYPVSSVCGERLPRTRFTKAGPVGDRVFGLFDDETHEIVYPSRQRHWNAAPMLSARLDDADTLSLSLDGTEWLRADDPQLKAGLASLFGRPVSVRRYGTDLAGRRAEPRYAHSPIHLLSRQSIDALKRLLPGSVIDERRFRPNIVVDFEAVAGDATPEQRLLGKAFRIGSLRLKGTMECGRCSFTTLQQLGLPEDRAVLRTLISDFEKNFGIYCEILDDGWIEEGDGLFMEPVRETGNAIVIVGAGQAGGMAAKALRELGHTGSITLFSDEGHPPYERPPLSKSFAVPRAGGKGLTAVLTGTEAAALSIDLHLNETVVHIDRAERTVETASGLRQAYDRLILATGGTARRVPLLSRGHGRVHTIRTASDAEGLRIALQGARRVFVLGGGWLGLEVAAAARTASIGVDLFARQARLCPRVLPAAVSDFVADVHRRNGVALHMSSMPVFEERSDGVAAHLNGEVMTADLLVVAIGIHPNDHLARRAGLDCRDGIMTDANGATSDPNIFAIGDVACRRSARHPDGMRIESWQNANDQADLAVRAVLGLASPPPSVPRFWSDQYDLTIQIAGLPDPSAEPLCVDGDDHPFWRFETFAVGVNRPREIHRFAAGLARRVDAPLTSTDDVPVRDEVTIRQKLGPLVPLADGEMAKVPAGAVGDIVLVRQGEAYFALQDKCPHADASLSEGFLEGGRIVCPLHFAEFDLASGAVHGGPKGCPRARSYRIEIEDGCLYLHAPAPTNA